MSKETFKYGRFLAAVKPSKQLGSWTAFYLMGEENSSKGEIWDEWSAIHYKPLNENGDVPFLTKGSGIMGDIGRWWGHPGVEDHDRFYYYQIEWIPNKMTFSIDGEVVRTLEGAEVLNLNEP